MGLNVDGFSSGRMFRLWDLAVSHSQLLIRSAKDAGDPKSRNIDLVFGGVFYLEVVEVFSGLEMHAPTKSETAELQVRSGARRDREHAFYVLQSGGMRRYVGAATLTIEENDLPPMQTSLGVL